MGNTWEVYGAFQYVLEYAGKSRCAAMSKARDLKKSGCGCIKIEWRP